MWSLKKVLLLCLPLLLLLSPACYASSYMITEEQIQAIETHLTELESNNARLSNLLNESENDLELALTALKASQSELKKLKAELAQALIDSEKAKQSLKIANQELATASESFKKLEQQKKRCERQRNFWEILAAIAAGVAAVR